MYKDKNDQQNIFELIFKAFENKSKIYVNNFQIDPSFYSAYDFLCYVIIISETSELDYPILQNYLGKYYSEQEVVKLIRDIENHIL